MHVSLCGFSTLFLIQVFHCKLQKCYYCVLGFLAQLFVLKRKLWNIYQNQTRSGCTLTLCMFFFAYLCYWDIFVLFHKVAVLFVCMWIMCCWSSFLFQHVYRNWTKKVFRSVHYQNVPNVHLVINSIGY